MTAWKISTFLATDRRVCFHSLEPRIFATRVSVTEYPDLLIKITRSKGCVSLPILALANTRVQGQVNSKALHIWEAVLEAAQNVVKTLVRFGAMRRRLLEERVNSAATPRFASSWLVFGYKPSTAAIHRAT